MAQPHKFSRVVRLEGNSFAGKDSHKGFAILRLAGYVMDLPVAVAGPA